jgi:hypothetical protein
MTDDQAASGTDACAIGPAPGDQQTARPPPEGMIPSTWEKNGYERDTAETRRSPVAPGLGDCGVRALRCRAVAVRRWQSLAVVVMFAEQLAFCVCSSNVDYDHG